MSSIEQTVWCTGCGVEIMWVPILVERRFYCCEDCSKGLDCECGSRMEMEEDRRNGKHSPTINSLTGMG
jgi:hypothetical protein